jgi:hypothetical protein
VVERSDFRPRSPAMLERLIELCASSSAERAAQDAVIFPGANFPDATRLLIRSSAVRVRGSRVPLAGVVIHRSAPSTTRRTIQWQAAVRHPADPIAATILKLRAL